MSVWRTFRKRDETRGRVTAIGADETAVRVKGEKTVIGVVADAATGEVLGMDVLVERDSDGSMEWLGDFARDFEESAPSETRPKMPNRFWDVYSKNCRLTTLSR